MLRAATQLVPGRSQATPLRTLSRNPRVCSAWRQRLSGEKEEFPLRLAADPSLLSQGTALAPLAEWRRSRPCGFCRFLKATIQPATQKAIWEKASRSFLATAAAPASKRGRRQRPRTFGVQVAEARKERVSLVLLLLAVAAQRVDCQRQGAEVSLRLPRDAQQRTSSFKKQGPSSLDAPER